MFERRDAAYETFSLILLIASSLLILSLYSRCRSLVAKNRCILGSTATFTAS